MRKDSYNLPLQSLQVLVVRSNWATTVVMVVVVEDFNVVSITHVALGGSGQIKLPPLTRCCTTSKHIYRRLIYLHLYILLACSRVMAIQYRRKCQATSMFQHGANYSWIFHPTKRGFHDAMSVQPSDEYLTTLSPCVLPDLDL